MGDIERKHKVAAEPLPAPAQSAAAPRVQMFQRQFRFEYRKTMPDVEDLAAMEIPEYLRR